MVWLDISEPDRMFACLEARSSLIEKIQAQQFEDPRLRVIQEWVLSGKSRKETLDPEGVFDD